MLYRQALQYITPFIHALHYSLLTHSEMQFTRIEQQPHCNRLMYAKIPREYNFIYKSYFSLYKKAVTIFTYSFQITLSY